ncbi:MAG: acyloxyacyl hydrolase [Kiritimatiellae bacterium]|nr:acyloxyacyl hydrolase [Kiritimatiellia bacterium]
MKSGFIYISIVIISVCLYILPSYAEKINSEPKPHYNQLLVGYGSSHPDWGMTTERVETMDIVFRHAHVFKQKKERWLKGSREFWVEAPVSILLSDSDDNDDHDFGMVGLNFLFAWVFPEIKSVSPYFIGGGGPVYFLADVDGVGSDLCGNYQFGGGIRFNMFKSQPINLEARYHHISNLGMAEPNISLNSTKFLVGFTLPF